MSSNSVGIQDFRILTTPGSITIIFRILRGLEHLKTLDTSLKTQYLLVTYRRRSVVPFFTRRTP